MNFGGSELAIDAVCIEKEYKDESVSKTVHPPQQLGEKIIIILIWTI